MGSIQRTADGGGPPLVSLGQQLIMQDNLKLQILHAAAAQQQQQEQQVAAGRLLQPGAMAAAGPSLSLPPLVPPGSGLQLPPAVCMPGSPYGPPTHQQQLLEAEQQLAEAEAATWQRQTEQQFGSLLESLPAAAQVGRAVTGECMEQRAEGEGEVCDAGWQGQSAWPVSRSATLLAALLTARTAASDGPASPDLSVSGTSTVVAVDCHRRLFCSPRCCSCCGCSGRWIGAQSLTASTPLLPPQARLQGKLDVYAAQLVEMKGQSTMEARATVQIEMLQQLSAAQQHLYELRGPAGG